MANLIASHVINGSTFTATLIQHPDGAEILATSFQVLVRSDNLTPPEPPPAPLAYVMTVRRDNVVVATLTGDAPYAISAEEQENGITDHRSKFGDVPGPFVPGTEGQIYTDQSADQNGITGALVGTPFFQFDLKSGDTVVLEWPGKVVTPLLEVYGELAPVVESDQYGALITPTGTLYVPTKSGSGSKIVRFNQGAAPETVIELPTEKGVHLMRHGATFYKGNAANELSSSADEGGSWTVESTAFTSDYKCIDWVPTAPDGGFIAIATKAKLLYSATSFDGTNWGAPVFQFGDGTRDVSRSQIEQSSASDESHILISDGTFAVRSDDYCATPGEVLFQ